MATVGDGASHEEAPSNKRSGSTPRPPRRGSNGARPAAGSQGAPSGQRAVGGKRHQARILALQILYEVDLTGHALDDVIAHTFAEQPPTTPIRAHAERLARGTVEARALIDPHIEAAASAFPLPQLPAVDRNVLRLAIFELLNEPEVPLKAAINEAVELAKRFGGANSGRFVNGVLRTVSERVDVAARRPEPAARPTTSRRRKS